jgi:SagB-type dehydrogenase family enzyme
MNFNFHRIEKRAHIHISGQSCYRLVAFLSEKIGDDFQRLTKYHRGQNWSSLDWSREPRIYKDYPENKLIPLPDQFPNNSLNIVEVLKKRKSIRSYSSEQLSISDLAFLLWASTGVRQRSGNRDFRVAPSAGALYPIETYLIVNNVEGLSEGVYHYNIKLHALEEIKQGDFSVNLAHAALEQKMCLDAPVIFIWTAIFERSRWKYKQRAYRYIYLDAGHIAQNLALAATAIDLGSCLIGAIYDDEVNEIVDVDGQEESTIYLSAVGHPQ